MICPKCKEETIEELEDRIEFVHTKDGCFAVNLGVCTDCSDKGGTLALPTCLKCNAPTNT